MKKFDWEKAKERNNPTHLNWLWNNHNKEMNEETYIKGMQDIRTYSGRDRKHGWRVRNKNYSPSNLKRQYRRLKNRFGFFQ